MPYEVDGFGPQIWNIALNRGHWYEHIWVNRSPSNLFHRNIVNWHRMEASELIQVNAKLVQISEQLRPHPQVFRRYLNSGPRQATSYRTANPCHIPLFCDVEITHPQGTRVIFAAIMVECTHISGRGSAT